MRLIHGDDTDVAWHEVPRAVSVEFSQALLEAGYDVELTLLEDATTAPFSFPDRTRFMSLSGRRCNQRAVVVTLRSPTALTT